MSFVYLRADVLRNVQERLTEKYGDTAGVLNEIALEAATARPRELEAYYAVVSAPQLAAALSWSVLRSRPFAYGNKRSAFAALVMMLDLNGFDLTCTEVEETAMVLRAAANEISEHEWTKWVGRVAAPKDESPQQNAD